MSSRPGTKLLCLWLAWSSLSLRAAAVATEPASAAAVHPPYRVSHWTTDHGLPQNRISALQQTRDGYLWIGTWFGLARFDGARFTVFDKHNSPALTNDTINALAEDTDGTLWAWGGNAHGQLGDGTMESRQQPVQIGAGTTWQTVAAGESHTLAVRSDGTLWAWGNNDHGQLGLGTDEP